MPKVSVIIPVYNAEKYLRKCLNSVVNQTLRDIEIICVNDGSTDGSLAILEEYAKKDSRIVVINQKNQGAGLARNKALKCAHGRYFVFMDPDDFYPNDNTLALLFNTIVEQKVLVCGGSLLYYENEFSSPIPPNFRKAVFENNGLMLFSDYQFDFYYQRFMYDLQVIKDNNIFFPHLRRYQDPPFFLNYMIVAQRFYALKNITYCYRVANKENLMSADNLCDRFTGTRLCLDIVKKHKLFDLYYQIVSRMNTDYFRNITQRHIKKMNVKIILQLFWTINRIDMKIIKRVNPDFVFNKFLSFYWIKNAGILKEMFCRK
jgi:glycosyltransferase involved in cell wall biosynthesis